MKTIKFRQENNGKWHYWGFIEDTFISPLLAGGKSYQFTGLVDKLGKEIYEGDIVNFGNYTDNGKPCNFETLFEAGCFKMREIRNFGGKRELIDNKECEVIGNIYENPELLK